MGIKSGESYKTKSGTRKFKIIGMRSKNIDNFPYIGECTGTGFITYFSFKGEHKLEEKYNLETDTHKYIGVYPDGSLSDDKFVPRNELGDGIYMGYLRAYEGSFKEVSYISQGVFNG